MPNMMALGGGASGRWLFHECGALVNEINTLLKETQESSLAPAIT